MYFFKKIKTYFENRNKEFDCRRCAIYKICFEYKKMSFEDLAKEMGVTVSWVERRMLPSFMLNKHSFCFKRDKTKRISDKDLNKFLDGFGMGRDEYIYWYRLFNGLDKPSDFIQY